MNEGFSGGRRPTGGERALAILVESGIIFCLPQVCIHGISSFTDVYLCFRLFTSSWDSFTKPQKIILRQAIMRK